MNHSPFWPLVWKEYRASRAFWLSMAAMGIVAQMSAFWLTRRPADRDWWLYGLALMVSTGFAVGIGGTLFAIEHEDRTFGLLRVLPLRPRELGGAKLLTALVGIVSLVAALWLSASMMAGWQPLSLREVGQLWGLWGLTCAEGLAWGVLCSLVMRSPLRATIATLLAVSLVNEFCVTLTPTHNLAMIASYVEAIPLRLAVLVVVVAADVWLLPRWLAGEYPGSRTRSAPERAIARPEPRKRERTWRESRQVVGHLVWQSWREGRTHVLLLLVGATIGLHLFREAYWAMLSLAGPVESDSIVKEIIQFLPAALLSTLVGVLVFHADQVHGPRFLAERGVGPRWVWLSRQLAWGGWLLVWAAVLVVLPIVAWLMQPNEPTTRYAGPWWQWQNDQRLLEHNGSRLLAEAWQYCGVLFCGYAVGQLVSLAVRRGVVAIVLAAALGPLVALWAWLMYCAQVPAAWSLLPLPLAMLLATWLRAPGWLIGREGRRGWIGPLAVVAVPVVLLAVGVPRFRAHQVWGLGTKEIAALAPLEANHSPEEIAEARITFDLYRRAADLYGNAPDEAIGDDRWERKIGLPDEPWVKEFVDAMLQAANRPYDLAALPLGLRRNLDRPLLDKLLLQEAALLESDGQFDRALDILMALLRSETQLEPCRDILRHQAERPEVPYRWFLTALCRWAAADGQSPERIRAAIRRLEDWHAGWPPVQLQLLTTYQTIRGLIEGEQSARAYGFNTEEAELTRNFSTERERALRLLDLIAARQITWTQETETRMDRGSSEEQWSYYNNSVMEPPFPGRVFWPLMDKWLETTPLVQPRFAQFSLPWYAVARETNYRATLIILALEAWKREHGHLPDTLEKLVGAGLDRVPLDPLYAYSFLYYPTGIPLPPRPVVPAPGVPALPGVARRLERLEAIVSEPQSYPSFMNGRPFLWSALNQRSYEELVRVAGMAGSVGAYYPAGGDNHPDHTLALDILEGGHAFEIP